MKPHTRDLKPNLAVFWNPAEHQTTYFCLLFTLGNSKFVRATGGRGSWDSSDGHFCTTVRIVPFPFAFSQGG